MAIAATLLATSGCDDVEEPSCDDVERACDNDGAERCSSAMDGVETCRENADGCLTWAVTETCSEGNWCNVAASSPSCTCINTCDVEGVVSCIGDTIVTCTADSAGCLAPVDTRDCSAEGLVCDDSAETPDCVFDCDNECPNVGDTSCDGNVIVTCATDANGCHVLEDTRDCQAEGLLCDVTFEAECVECDNECDAAGETMCEGDSIMTCTADADGCLFYEETTDCGDDGNVCVESSGTPECAGCGACGAPGEYCDDTASPPECLIAGTVSDILVGVAPDTGWDELDPMTQVALEARAELTLAEYREFYGPAPLDAAVDTMLTASTAEMDTNYAAFLSAIFGVDAVTNAELDESLKTLYVLATFAWQIWTANYHGMPPLAWDGITDITYMVMPDSDSMGAYEGLGGHLADAFDVLRSDAGLSDEEASIAEHAMALARQFKSGSTGYNYGGDDLSTVHGLTGNAFDFLLNYADFVFGNIFTSDDAFLDQFNAYLFSDLIRIWEGSAVALDFQFTGFGDPGYVGMFVGDPAENEAAQLFLLLSNLFYDRVMAHPDIDEPCYLYSSAQRARIWDAFTADSYDNNDGTTSFESFHTDFMVYASEERERFKDVTIGALMELFPSDSAAMTVEERDAIIVALNLASTLGEVRAAFDDGLAAAGDGTALEELAAAMESVTIIGGRDYEDPDDGDTWLAEDSATVQAMWDEVRDWVLAEYGFAEEVIPEDLIVITAEDGYVVAEGYYYGIGWPRSLIGSYRTLMRAASNLVSIYDGLNLIGPAFFGLAVNTDGMVLDRFLAATLSAAETANRPFYRLDGSEREAYLLAGNDAALRRFMADSCPPEGQVEWIGTTIADEWGVTDDWRPVLTPYVLLGPWTIDYDIIAYNGTIAYLQDRLDTDHGEGSYSVDPFVLQVCGLYNPLQDDATYEALEACIVP